MKSLYELVAPYDSVSLIGMCKNAGKTTTLNQLIAELKRNGAVSYTHLDVYKRQIQKRASLCLVE